MKKLMLAIGVGVLTLGLHAATYNWSVASSTAVFNGYDGTSTGVYSGATAQSGLSYYFICAATVSQGDLLDALRDGGSITDYASLTSGTTGTDGKIAYKAFTADSGLVQTDGKMYAYFAILNDDASYVFLSSSSSVTANTSGGQADYSVGLNTSKALRDLDGTTAYGSAGWYAVPEPTSGLLLLIGMAGLALKRKRA